MVNIAIHNFHKLPQLIGKAVGINGYVVELIKRGYVRYLYFDDYHYRNTYRQPITDVIAQIRRMYSWQDLGLDKVELVFSPKTLRSKCDILLNFNTPRPEEFTNAIKKFEGLKIYHLQDYFWANPASEKNELLVNYGVDYVLSYGRADKYCRFFQHCFPSFIGRVIPVPYGFNPRFVQRTEFGERKKKCVAVGSVHPLCNPDTPPGYWSEPATFFPDELWTNPFGRMLFLNKERLADVMDSMLPEFPRFKDFGYDVVAKYNEYQMFVPTENIYHFPAAKTWEGPAAGCVMVCSDHPCFTDLGFVDGVNCIKYKEYDIDDFREKVSRYLDDQEMLAEIQKAGTAFVRANYSHEVIADRLYSILTAIYTGGTDVQERATPHTDDTVPARRDACPPLEVSWVGDFPRPQIQPTSYHPETLRMIGRILILLSAVSRVIFVYEVFRFPRRTARFVIRRTRRLLRL